MGSLMHRNKDIARRKGAVAAMTAAGGVVLTVAGAPFIGASVVAFAAYLGYDWFMFRAKNGMRF